MSLRARTPVSKFIQVPPRTAVMSTGGGSVDRIRDRVAGLDVHRDSVVACLRLAVGGDIETVKRSFSTMSAGVSELAVWLSEHQVGTVVMEATGVYWKPVYYGLEGLVGELWLGERRARQAGAGPQD